MSLSCPDLPKLESFSLCCAYMIKSSKELILFEGGQRELTLDFMWGRLEGASTNLRKLVPTWCECHFKEFGAKLMICYYITVFKV